MKLKKLTKNWQNTLINISHFLSNMEHLIQKLWKKFLRFDNGGNN